MRGGCESRSLGRVRASAASLDLDRVVVALGAVEGVVAEQAHAVVVAHGRQVDFAGGAVVAF